MSKIKVSELFYSLQGEGKYVGVPSIFLRTFGCNFTCSGFGMKRGEASTERHDVDPAKYTDYKALPLVSTGCDSYASWDPRFKHLSPMMTVESIVDEMQKLLPEGKFGPDKHLIITGGEPLLGWQRAFPDLFDEIINRKMNLTHITFETNGTQLVITELQKWILENKQIEITFSVSAKLPVSGEKWEDAIQTDILAHYDRLGNAYLKFVVASLEDIEDVKRAVYEYQECFWDENDFKSRIPVYLMPVGGTNSVYELNERNVADYCRDNGYRFSPRIQVPLYKNAWGT